MADDEEEEGREANWVAPIFPPQICQRDRNPGRGSSSSSSSPSFLLRTPTTITIMSMSNSRSTFVVITVKIRCWLPDCHAKVTQHQTDLVWKMMKKGDFWVMKSKADGHYTSLICLPTSYKLHLSPPWPGFNEPRRLGLASPSFFFGFKILINWSARGWSLRLSIHTKHDVVKMQMGGEKSSLVPIWQPWSHLANNINFMADSQIGVVRDLESCFDVRTSDKGINKLCLLHNE